jgi:hypothetical protein
MSFGFNDGPQFSTIPAVPASGWVTPIVQNGNTHTTTTIDTLAVGTSMLAVGMTVAGSGVPTGATVATIASATSVTISVATTSTVSTTPITFGGVDPLQSAFAYGSTFQGFPPASATPTPGCAFAIPDQQVIAASGTYIFASGRGLMVIGAGATTAPTLQYNLNGTWTTVLTGSITVSTAMYVMCDGANVRVNNPGTAGLTVTFYRESSSKQ